MGNSLWLYLKITVQKVVVLAGDAETQLHQKNWFSVEIHLQVKKPETKWKLKNNSQIEASDRKIENTFYVVSKNFIDYPTLCAVDASSKKSKRCCYNIKVLKRALDSSLTIYHYLGLKSSIRHIVCCIR